MWLDSGIPRVKRLNGKKSLQELLVSSTISTTFSSLKEKQDDGSVGCWSSFLIALET
jgi:hypothetical protein